jgi:hypothetical protein
LRAWTPPPVDRVRSNSTVDMGTTFARAPDGTPRFLKTANTP